MPTPRHHVAVWLDHHQAHFFRIDAGTFSTSALPAAHHHVRRHPDRSAAEPNHPDDLKRFFHDVASAVASADEVLIVGPSTAKLQFIRYLHTHAPAVEASVVGVETADHPTDAQFAAIARRYFGAPDRMKGVVR